MTDDCRHRDDAGPWVLGALDDEDARAFAEHLESCSICRLEVAELQVVADVLPMAAPQLRAAAGAQEPDHGRRGVRGAAAARRGARGRPAGWAGR